MPKSPLHQKSVVCRSQAVVKDTTGVTNTHAKEPPASKIGSKTIVKDTTEVTNTYAKEPPASKIGGLQVVRGDHTNIFFRKCVFSVSGACISNTMGPAFKRF